MGSSNLEGKVLEMFEVGPCGDAYHMGLLIGQRFSNHIKSRLARDLILQDQLRPFAQTPQAHPLLKALTDNNKKKFPRYWDELLGTAEGSGAPVLDVIFRLNFKLTKRISIGYLNIFVYHSYSSCSSADNTDKLQERDYSISSKDYDNFQCQHSG